jgi:hypothetical protein
LASSTTKVVSLPLLRRGDIYESRDVDERHFGSLMVRLSLAPALIVEDDRNWFVRHNHTLPALPHREARCAMIRDALARFGSQSLWIPGLGHQDVKAFCDVMRDTTGIPAPIVLTWFDMLSAAFEQDVADVAPQGGLEAVSLPANTFLCLSSALRALVRASAVWIRPSRQEPFSAVRLVAALIASGWPPSRLGLYPTTHEVLQRFCQIADRAVAFGGEELVSAIGHRPHVEVHGPGRACALVSRDVDVSAASEWLVGAIAGNAGRLCTNVGTILYNGDVDSLGAALAKQLDGIAVDGHEERCPQALAASLVSPGRIQAWIEKRTLPGDKILTTRGFSGVTPAGTMLMPSLIRLDHAHDHPLLGAELPFAFAAIARAKEADQPLLCTRSAFVYTVGDKPSPYIRKSLPRSQIIHVTPSSNQGRFRNVP